MTKGEKRHVRPAVSPGKSGDSPCQPHRHDAASASLSQPDGTMTEDMLAYYEARAKGGFGLIFTGAFHPDTLVDPVHPLDSKQPLKAPKAFQRSAVELLERLDATGPR